MTNGKTNIANFVHAFHHDLHNDWNSSEMLLNVKRINVEFYYLYIFKTSKNFNLSTGLFTSDPFMTWQSVQFPNQVTVTPTNNLRRSRNVPVQRS